MDHPLLDLTFGPMSAPEVKFDEITRQFWLSWRTEHTHIDVILRDRDELRALTRGCLEAAEVCHEAAHPESHPRVA